MPDNTPNNPLDTPVRRMDRVLTKPWWKRRPFQLTALGLVLVAGTVATVALLPASGTVTVAANSLDTGAVVRGPFQDYVPLRASVVPLDTVYVTSQTNGRVDSVAAQDGEQVTPGQALMRLSNPELTLEVSSREADISGRLSDSNNQLMNLQTQQQARQQALADAAYAVHKAETDLAKRRLLLDQGVLNEAAVKPFADEVDYQRSRLATLKSTEAQETAFYRDQHEQILSSANDLRRSLTEVRQGLSALTVTAPVAGRLTDFDFKPGQAIKQGDPLGEVDSEGTYKLRAEVDEYYLSRLSPGLAADAQVHGRTMTVKVSKVFPQVNNGRITVELAFAGAMPSDLKRGEAIDTRLSLGSTQSAVLAPAGTWLNDSGGTYVFVLDASGRHADRRTVSLGRRNPEFAEVLTGLKPGDRIVTGGTANLTRAQHLRLEGKNE